LLAASAFTTSYDPLPDLPLGADLAVLVLPNLGLGLAVGRYWAAAVPFLVAAPLALAGDDGSNAFSYRLPALAIGVFALAAAVLVLTGVLLRTGRSPVLDWAGVALLLVGALPLLSAGYRQVRPLDENGDRIVQTGYRGVTLGSTRAEAVEALGEPARSQGASVAPLGDDFDDIGGPPFIATPGSSHEALRYPDVTVLLADGRVHGLVITDSEAETDEGVGVGDNLELAEERYPKLDCGIAEADEYRTFPYCGGRLRARRWIWFGQDPIRSIVLTSSELGRSETLQQSVAKSDAPRSGPDELVDAAFVQRDDVELALRILAEAGEALDAERLGAYARRAPAADAEAVDPIRVEVAVEVAPAQRGERLAAIDVAPDHR
jgi:hypothetical protein